MKVLVIPEDFRKDQYLLKPIIAALMRDVGAPRATVRVCLDPLLGGIVQALKWDRIRSILDQYRMVDPFILCVDRDGESTRREALDNLESQAADVIGGDRLLLAENAWQEIEIWGLAGQDLPSDWSWKALRAERDPKSAYFEPFVRDRGLLDAPGGGRKVLGVEAASRFDRLLRLCPEDLGALRARLEIWIRSRD